MLSNCTLEDIKPIPFGGHINGNHKTFKMKYIGAKARFIMSKIPQQYHQSIKIYVCKSTEVIMVLSDPMQSYMWHYFQQARELAIKKQFGQAKLF